VLREGVLLHGALREAQVFLVGDTPLGTDGPKLGESFGRSFLGGGLCGTIPAFAQPAD
jgi:hypothetical protein